MKSQNLFLTTVIFLSGLILYSCSHTNELMRYDISSKTIFFKHKVVKGNADADVRYGDGRFGTKTSWGERIFSTIGSAMFESEVEAKLQKVFSPENIVGKLSEEIKNDLELFIAMVPVYDHNNDPEFIGETLLYGFKLISDSKGISASITAEFNLTERKSGTIIWKNKKTIKSLLKDSPTRYVYDSGIRKAGSVINAIRLAEMSEEEIETAISIAADEVSYRLLKDLRDDISEAKK